jgi:hypothetical protein
MTRFLAGIKLQCFGRVACTSGWLWSGAAHGIGGRADSEWVFAVTDPDASTFDEATKSRTVELIQSFGGMMDVHKLHGISSELIRDK